jgi:hypothetical protein
MKSATGTVRSPCRLTSTSEASAASSTGSPSPAGLAVPMLPPIVAALRICGEPTVRAAAASAGSSSASSRSMVVQVTAAPMSISSARIS